MRTAWLLVLVASTAGCASSGGAAFVADDAGPSSIQPTYLPPNVSRGVHNETLAAANFALAPADAAGFAREQRVPLTIPNGTVQVLVRLTPNSGASFDLSVQLGTCAERIGPLAPATGWTRVIDCGGLIEGPEDLVLEHVSGYFTGMVEVVAAVCNGPTPRNGGCNRLP